MSDIASAIVESWPGLAWGRTRNLTVPHIAARVAGGLELIAYPLGSCVVLVVRHPEMCRLNPSYTCAVPVPLSRGRSHLTALWARAVDIEDLPAALTAVRAAIEAGLLIMPLVEGVQ